MHSHPIRPKFSLSRLLWGALILFLSLHDLSGGTPVIRGVLAAPAKRNRDKAPAQDSGLPPAQPENFQQVDPNQFAHTGVSLAEPVELVRPTQPEMPVVYLGIPEPESVQSGPQLGRSVDQNQRAGVTQERPALRRILPAPPTVLPAPPTVPPAPPPVHPDQPVIISLSIQRRFSPGNQPKNDMDKPAGPRDKWTLQGGNYFAISLPHTDISATAAMVSAGGRTRKPKRVSSVKWGPGFGGTDKVSINPGMAIGTITYASESTAKSQTIPFLHKINNDKPATNLLYLLHAVSEAKKAGLEIEMNDDWYYLVAGMLHVKGSGSGDAISETDAELQKVYSDLLANIIRERSADDPRLLEFKPKQ
ncbi:hypothetical protein F5880DRAFT_1618647 [Lentinula raphanica]|nr:hypothetical protein F5880DRAFT_1618647 [Lentinula raphanica]